MDFSYEPGRFYMQNDNELIAEIKFEINNNVLSINHTFVNNNYRGKGIARKLILKVISYAQQHNLLIKPVCSYAVKFFEHTDKYNALLV
ncbi:GNAT family N-acetyltransferase [Apilactobacillus ozensis]|uniref:Uncharacterized protein n=1 Tax=Apilactobacillus ozensis DSM 23829 = JCM 17196 TaxID=1423781 RepID=A0A0R2APD6_9LACO|nr:GNAT family N-acetyltransferase [Apilactobacillus ozensis]KRM67604.1 hypothetical protein FD06_GL000756 [Apilactobacillus ozensis DSM 23829 = JCM 17196]MCK8607241.1 N-acetyltransferase [Apilactobacillus ozensis]